MSENLSPDCLIVLGARITPDGRPGRIARLRVEHALKLWLERGATGCLILSGGCSREGLAVSEARAMADHVLEQVQAAGGRELRERLSACLVLEEDSRTTREAARHTLPLSWHATSKPWAWFRTPCTCAGPTTCSAAITGSTP